MKFKDKSVLVIDDMELQRVMLEALLERMGVGTIYLAEDGLEGIRTARYYKPDLVLLDLNMPNIDGFETCKKIRLFANKIVMPVLIVTGEEKAESLQRIYELGANDYFEKPFNSAEVTNRVSFYLEYCDMLKKHSELAQNIHRDLEVAKKVQNKTIPSPLEKHVNLKELGLDFYSYSASEMLGGDSWGVLNLACGAPIFFIFDVTGHGINAAINNSFITSLTVSAFAEFKHNTIEEFSPAAFLMRLNFLMCEHLQVGTFCAGACFIVDKDIVRYAGCAFPDLKAINRATKTVESLPCKGLPMGVSDKGFVPTEGDTPWDDDVLLLALTDGLIESMSKNHEGSIQKYGRFLPGERLLALCLESLRKEQTSQEVLDMLIETFQSNDYNLTEDDITILALQRSSDLIFSI